MAISQEDDPLILRKMLKEMRMVDGLQGIRYRRDSLAEIVLEEMHPWTVGQGVHGIVLHGHQGPREVTIDIEESLGEDRATSQMVVLELPWQLFVKWQAGLRLGRGGSGFGSAS